MKNADHKLNTSAVIEFQDIKNNRKLNDINIPKERISIGTTFKGVYYSYGQVNTMISYRRKYIVTKIDVHMCKDYTIVTVYCKPYS